MTRRTLSIAGITGALLVSTALGVGCSAKTQPYPGGLMVAVQTDLVAPKDVTAVGLFISSDGRPVFSDTRDTAPNGEVHFPATIAVIADESRPGAVIKIRAVAFTSDNKVRVLRDAITTVPKGRTGLLKMPLLWINEGSGTGSRADIAQAASVRIKDASLDTLSNVKSTCTSPTETYVDGECKDANVDSTALPEYQETDIFGGGHADGTDGSCFDVKACFDSAKPVSVDESCVATLPAGQSPSDTNLSLAVALKQAASGAASSTGECLGNGVCVVPLDKGDWTAKGNSIQLPPALCKRIKAGSALGIVATHACPSKTDSTPACGPASAVASDHPVTPDGGVDGPGVIDFDSSVIDASLDAELDASPPLDAGVDATALDAGVDASVFDASVPDATVEAGPDDAGTSTDTGIVADAAIDSTIPDGSIGDAQAFDATPGFDFSPATSYTIQEPDVTHLEFDGQRVFVARGVNGTSPPNVVSFLLSDLIANPSNPSFPRITYYADTDTIGTVPPLYDIRYNGKTPLAVTAAYPKYPPKLLDCAFQDGGAGCMGTAPVPPLDTSGFDIGFEVGSSARLYASLADIPTIEVLDYNTSNWTSFSIPGSTYKITALHYMQGANTLLVGMANGDIYRCPDVPCTATNGAFYSAAPPGQVTAFADDGTLMYWATQGQGIFKENAVAPILLTAGPLIDTSTTSLALDGKYVYYGDNINLHATNLDGSTVNAPLFLASAQGPITSVVSTPDHVFFTALPAPSSLNGMCKRFVTPGCN